MTLHYLRHVLEPHLVARQTSTFIRSDGAGRYWFDLSDYWWTDVLETERLFAAAKAAELRGESQSAITLYERHLDYYARTFLPEDVFDEVFDSFRAAHDVVHDTAQSRLLRLYVLQGLSHKALCCALSILDRDPYSEEAATAIGEVYLRQGNVLAASMQLEGYLQTIERGLGVKPGPEVVQLWEQVRGRR